MRIGIPKEVHLGEHRVAATPGTAKRLQKLGFEVLVESWAGQAAGYTDERYREAGCEIVPSTTDLWSRAQLILKVRPPEDHPQVGVHETQLLKEGATLISFIWPAQNPALLEKLAARKATVLAMDQVPRITRAQKLDALSSMANIAGYRAVIEAANHFPRFFTGQITAAGKVPPAKVLIIGAGVAGLAAIGAAKSLGAIVRAFDTRPVVKEQVQSMGAEFLEVLMAEDGSGEGGYAKEVSKEFIEKEMALFAAQAKEVDIIITTALIPGKPAPRLITREMVESMNAGAVIVDMAAEQGGNCELTKPGQIIKHGEVTLIGLTDLPSRMANQSSQLYSNNLINLLEDMGGGTAFKVDPSDEVVRGCLVLNNGEMCWPPPKPAAPRHQARPSAAAVPVVKTPATAVKPGHGAAKKSSGWLGLAAAALALAGVGLVAPPSFLEHLTVFVLAVFVGYQVIWNVTPALHTPLMSVTNAVSGIIILGGLVQLQGPPTSVTSLLGLGAVFLATINIAGGFLVTQRMLKMFRK